MRTEGSVPSGKDRPSSRPAGRIVGPKRALKEKQIWAIRFYLSSQKRVRDRALFDIAIDSKLRGCDVVQLRVGDVTSGSHIRTRSTVVQQKTGRPVQFEITETARDSCTRPAWAAFAGPAVRCFYEHS
ncbi:hypothetical protein ROTAS13_03594 [Roseomonas sp. TAS13]|uniref:hypothetical protein n=1 Tax=Roseomonas sp. TAS13 TaxID=1926319 RepID=UPI00096986A9|nr:hypothetical protein [Roseomonas sp. TAS13]GAV35913.1 hypothetical protein ROTAS13_03594 [Roseomonas sp. TAS13]